MRISLFIDSRHTKSAWRLRRWAASEKLNVVEGPAVGCDRTRRVRLGIQLRTGRHAIALMDQGSHREQDKRDQKGENSVDLRLTQIARKATRVAERIESG
jgi:hypothetical protein